ncbi:hypothetical protein GW920_02790 [Candidatus Falkowbacteria bacterium]|nr:hypothetical protein [Candidatus Falkowbacteria bacterium]NCQ12899.1 hypothetical protein [Candidatus Falkowbacteria bacterium]OIO06665.1 MAG: hypothetical protein AUJ26_00170 [Candidatus Falkowbacteria bacterium CG1_02_37_21]
MSITKKRLFSFVLLAIFSLATISFSLPAQANPDLVDSQAGWAEIGQIAFGSSDTPDDIRFTMARVINVALGFLGIIFLIIAVVAGFQYMTSRGNEEKTKEAMSMLRNAIIGLVIVLVAWILTRYSVIVMSQTVNGMPGYQFYPSY